MHKVAIHLHIQLQSPYIIGNIKEAVFKIIPIIGGEVSGSIEGSILKFGADYNFRINDFESDVDACYIIQTKDNQYIMVRNQGHIDKNQNCYMTHPKFYVDENSDYAYLMNKDFYGKILKGTNTFVDIEIREVENEKY